jgi:signal transduction histidine kinase
MEIEDDGCGFVVDNTDGGGMGMKNMRERAIQAGGRLEIFSAPGHGTKVSVMLSDQFEASKLEFLG